MKKSVLLLFLVFTSFAVIAQEGFTFDANKKKVVIPFELINNLIFIPITVNGVELTFLLDTGADETILFSLEDKQEVSFSYVQKIRLRGLGNEDPIEGLKSSHNILSFPGLSDREHDIYIVLDQNFNFSSSVGIPVNGIIGYHFFKNHLVNIDYESKKITIYNDSEKARKKFKKYQEFPITIESNKPYLDVSVTLSGRSIAAKLLMDSGSSDAIWLFSERSKEISLPKKHFTDFLGRGFSGDIEGERARIEALNFDSFEFKNAIGAFPDAGFTKDIVMVNDRVGSIGGEILKRFAVVFDYEKQKVYLKRNRAFDDPFNYNMSGMEIHHTGMSWIKETVELHPVSENNSYDGQGEKILHEFAYKFELKPTYAVANIRNDSPAAIAGIEKGDVIISINGRPSYKYTLQQINSMLKSDEGNVISMEVERNGKIMKFRFELKSII